MSISEPHRSRDRARDEALEALHNLAVPVLNRYTNTLALRECWDLLVRVEPALEELLARTRRLDEGRFRFCATDAWEGAPGDGAERPEAYGLREELADLLGSRDDTDEPKWAITDWNRVLRRLIETGDEPGIQAMLAMPEAFHAAQFVLERELPPCRACRCGGRQPSRRAG